MNKELAVFRQKVSEFLSQLPIDSTESRHRQLAAIALRPRPVIELPYGLDIPRTDISLELLCTSADFEPAIEYLVSRITLDESLGCWAIQLAAEHDTKGRARYPTVSSRRFGAHSELAHRYVVRRLVGPLRTDQHLDHICRNHACCNPTHLSIVDHTQNMTRGSIARRAITGQSRADLGRLDK